MKRHEQKRLNKKVLFYTALMILSLTGCKKLVDVEAPVTSITVANVYTTDATAIGVLTGLYEDISQYYGTSIYNSSAYLGLAADEFKLINPLGNTYTDYYRNSLSSVSGTGAGFELWNTFYNKIYSVNEALAGIQASTGLSAGVKQQLLGEAQFMRAFYYFQLTNLYGDVPLVLTTDYKTNQVIARTAQATVYGQIKTDLLNAQKLLTKNFTDATLVTTSTERLRPTYWAATALLARVYLYNQDWANAETQSSILLSNSALFSLSTLQNSFLRAGLGNNEAIWQLQPVGAPGAPVLDATYFDPAGTPPSNFSVLSDNLLNAFENGDQRRTQ